MKYDVPMRINVLGPPTGVTMQIQRGRADLWPPTERPGQLTFDFMIKVDISSGVPNFLGEFAQGPKDSRFIYVNSGTYAGQYGTCWSRRAKISLVSVTREQVDHVLSDPKRVLETSFMGTGRDGSPTCASVEGIEWKVVDR